MKRKALTWIEALVIIAIIGIIAAILIPVFSRSGHSERRYYCQSNLKNIALGLRMYTADYDVYPRIAAEAGSSQRDKDYPNGVYGWADALEPYTKSTSIFHCPNEKSRRDAGKKPQETGYTDYWFNSRLATARNTKLKNPASIILLGEGNDGFDLTDACYAYGSLPGGWINLKNSPSFRHAELANYAFVDGHVKALKPHQIGAKPPSGKNYTFRIQ